MKHYQLSELDRYQTGRLPLLDRLFCRWHLTYCPRCRMRLLRLKSDDQLLLDVKNSIGEMAIPENEATYRKLCRSFREEPRQ